MSVRIDRQVVARLLRFGSVGVIATLIYAAVAWSLGRYAGVGAVLASILAYGVAGLFAYVGHKRFTFRSTGSHADDAPRFIAAQLLGIGIATAAPYVLTVRLHAPALAPILFTCVAVPLLNYLVLDLLVFRSGRATPKSAESSAPKA